MKVIQEIGREDLAVVYIGETEKGRIEFAQSLQPPHPREEKWVLIVSSLYGCPIECEMCDAGGSYSGKLSTSEILAQIDHMVSRYYPNRKVPVRKFKIQFARVGEPAFNANVLDALKRLPRLYDAPGLIPCLSTVAPSGCDNFFEELLKIREEYYPRRFQLQFSLHSTDESQRDKIIPTKKWGLEKIAEYGARFYRPGSRKITLNFILADKYIINAKKLRSLFSPEIFFIKLTPLNPTCRATLSGLRSAIYTDTPEPEITSVLREWGYDVLVSIGELEENLIGSNCGQYIKTYEEHSQRGGISFEGYQIKDYLGS